MVRRPWKPSMRLHAWMLALLIACGASEPRRKPLQRSRAESYENATVAASLEAATAATPPPCAASAGPGQEATATTPDWTHGTFFDRVRNQLMTHWKPAALLSYIDPGARQYGNKRRTAALRVCLLRTGELAGVTITRSSGVPELDDAMVRAFQASAPFLNPPETLAQGDDQFRFAYSFEFYTTPPGGGPVMSMYPSRANEP